jgi:hypothetical protein
MAVLAEDYLCPIFRDDGGRRTTVADAPTAFPLVREAFLDERGVRRTLWISS